MEYNLDELEWKCADCGVVEAATNAGYMMILKHQKGHHVQLVSKVTGEVLANSPQGAQVKGIDIPGKPGAKPGTKTEGLGLEFTEEGITLPVTLPPVVFTLFDIGKASGRVPEEMDLDSWLVECVQKRYELDYRMRLMLVPVAKDEG